MPFPVLQVELLAVENGALGSCPVARKPALANDPKIFVVIVKADTASVVVGATGGPIRPLVFACHANIIALEARPVESEEYVWFHPFMVFHWLCALEKVAHTTGTKPA